MVRLLRRLKPHIIFSTLGYIVTASIASIFSKNKIIIISRFGNTMSSFLNEQKDQSLVKYFLQFAVNKLVIYLSDLIIVQSNHMKDDLNRIFSRTFSIMCLWCVVIESSTLITTFLNSF